MLVKFKIGQKVIAWESELGCWVTVMNLTINKVFSIFTVGDNDYQLNTTNGTSNYLKYDYYYPEESLEAEIQVGQQLLFPFMELV